MTQLFKNNAASVLASAASISDEVLYVADGDSFPNPGAGDYFLLTLVRLDTNSNEDAWEIVKVTARAGATLTVQRAQEGTAALAWPIGSLAECRLTAGALEAKQDKLVSGANLKTVNGESLLGEGDLGIESGSGKLSAINPVITGSITEGVYAISGATPAIDPANGTIQTWALAGASTPTDALSSGQSLTLMIDDGAGYTITWPPIQWVGGTAPTLATAGYTVVELWKVGAVLYGALVGSVA